ncbi:methyltransferase domain-containing protein [Pseudonocardia broussonetiae]|uniref:Protein-L-isoaspartate O-methyltransferase n=1 Tax=Pseudonocardia broussonetiae TaxID=2736640 RepID=A0A6M6JJG8_9PSEU|nr:methyltransferase domain-containing protein [Pseudonocardia broussonetiae]QJY47170.1 methyltransferase domain-containing protein [Pseudonocardia broussonetiae]
MPAAEDVARAALVDALRASGRIRSPAVEDAFRSVPRHLFLPDATVETAYADDAIAVQHVEGVATSSASQPSMVAIMLEQLDLRPGMRVLEIGAGTGWNAALMARIVGPTGSVTTVDIDPHLVDSAGRHLAAAGVTDVRLRSGDGVLGVPDGAPYDRIVLTVGSDDVWPAWVEQLAPGGRLLLPLAVRGTQLSTALDLGPDGVLRSHSVRSCGFIRLRGMGAVDEGAVEVPGVGSLLVPSDGPRVDAEAVAAVLADPRGASGPPVSLGRADLWDGFGLWLALTEPGAGRLLPAAEPPPGLDSPALVLVEPAGVAAVVPGAGARVHVFGSEGAEVGRRLGSALRAWSAAGSPGGPDWRVVVVPGLGDPPSGSRVVRTAHNHLLLELAR